MTTGVLGAIAREEGDAQRAFDLMAEAAALAHEFRLSWWEGGLLAELASLSLNAGRVDEAEEARAEVTRSSRTASATARAVSSESASSRVSPPSAERASTPASSGARSRRPTRSRRSGAGDATAGSAKP